MLKHSDGRVTHQARIAPWVEPQVQGAPDYIESIIDLKDPDAMPVPTTGSCLWHSPIRKKPSAF
jgi:hypothetical protein